MADFGLKASAKNINCLTVKPADLIVSSQRDITKIVIQGFNIFRHGLNYKPFAVPVGNTNNFEILGSSNRISYVLSQQGF